MAAFTNAFMNTICCVISWDLIFIGDSCNSLNGTLHRPAPVSDLNGFFTAVNLAIRSTLSMDVIDNDIPFV